MAVHATSRDSEPAIRVALYTPAWPAALLPNGIATYTGHLVPSLRELGVEISVIAGALDPGCSDPGVSLAVPERDPLLLRLAARVREPLSPGAGSERRNALAILRQVQRLERARGVDLIEIEESFGWCGWLASRCRAPIVARLHGPWFLNGTMVEDPRTRAFRRRVRREGRAIARVAGITAPSRDVLARTRSHYGLELPEAEVIPYPVSASDAPLWDSGNCAPTTVLFVGRFDNHKGGDTIVEAFARVRASERAARLIFVGPDRGVTDASGRSWSFGEFLAKQLPSASDRNAVEWRGQQPPIAIQSLRRCSAVTVVCSRYETFGYTLAEAMAQGCPIVATAAGGMVELIEHERNGLLVRPADPADLASAILRLLRDRELARRLGRSAAVDCAERCDPALIARRTLAFYRRILRRDRPCV